MRCYLMKDGHIAAVEMLRPGSDADLITQCATIWNERKDKYDGFEVWDQARFIHAAEHPN